MKNDILCLTIGLTSCLFVLLIAACGNDDEEGLIPDPNLRKGVAGSLSKAPDEEITTDDLTTLTELSLWHSGPHNWVRDLTGLEYCVNLTSLTIYFGAISDISPLSNLSNLRTLDLTSHRITDISPLAELTSLMLLQLTFNDITDIGPLSGLTDLSTVVLDGNLITDLQPLATNPGLGAGDIVSVVNNPLSEMSLNIHVPALRTRGVEVRVE